MSNLSIARTRRARELKFLKFKRDNAERKLNDGMIVGGLGPDYTRMAELRRQSKLEQIATLTRQIDDLESLEGDALKARFDPDPIRPKASRGKWLGPKLDPA